MRRRLICIFLVLCLALGIAACGDGDKGKKPGGTATITLSAPANLRIMEQGDVAIVRWDVVENAESYIVTVNGTDNTTTENTWTLQSLFTNYTVSVVACRKGSQNSAPSTVSYTRRATSLTISGSSECRSGKTLQLEASVVNAPANSGVTWEITAGKDYAEIDQNGLITAKPVSGDKNITVKATSKFDTGVSAIKVITITAKPELTQEMLDELNEDNLAFDGFLELQRWSFGIGVPSQLEGAITLNVKTAMDEDSWYSEYQDMTGITRFISISDRDDVDGRESTACTYTVDLMNNATTEPLLDADGNYQAWADVDYKNNMRDFDVDDFTFNESKWRWEYVGSGSTEEKQAKMRAILASVHVFDFVPKSVYLLVDDGMVVGMYAESEDDYTMNTGSIVRMFLTVSLNVGNSIEVPTLEQYEHKDMHDELQAAIDRMHALTSYTTECLDNGSALGSATYNGYIETVTQDACYMRPYDFEPFQTSLVEIGSGNHRFSNNDFGYVKCTDDLYNSFTVTDGVYRPHRSYSGEFIKNAPPTFAFTAEIFTDMKENADGSKTYYVDTPMLTVATTLYHGIGNDMAVYGIYANATYRTRAYLPYVTVNTDGYISKAGFSYYMGSYYGELKIEYRDFNTAELTQSVIDSLEEIKNNPRTAPTDWSEVTIMLAKEDNREVVAKDYFETMFDASFSSNLPYFGTVLGDTFNSAITDFRSISYNGNRVSVDSVKLFFEVPYDIDNSIDTSLAKVRELLDQNGFTKSGTDTYVKGNMSVEPINDQMRLLIYVWNNIPKQ